MTRARGLAVGLPTPLDSVRKLQRALYTKAKAEPDFRFYSLWDKVLREDVLWIAYQRCRQNQGGAGIDGETFSRIETNGLQTWLGRLREELKAGEYRSRPLKRVWIPKANGGQRPLGIPCLRDRVVQMAVSLVLTPIFEPDFPRNQYGFRPRLDAKMAVRKVYYHVTKYGRTEVVDADLKDYFNTIPHGPLMKSVSRRISDGRVLALLKKWLESPVIEAVTTGEQRTTVAKDSHRGTPQGGVISPLLANLYFRRFLKAWETLALERRGRACVVNYADDLVICCIPGYGQQAMGIMEQLMVRLGLTVNQEKSRLVTLPEGSFDFLGYTVGRRFNRHGEAYIGTSPSQKALKRVIKRVHDETAITTTWDSVERRIDRVNAVVRGWAGYFNQGPILEAYRILERYAANRIRRWLVKKHRHRGTKGYRRFPDSMLHETLGLIRLPMRMADLPSAKV